MLGGPSQRDEELFVSAARYFFEKNYLNASLCFKKLFEKYPENDVLLQNLILCGAKLEFTDDLKNLVESNRARITQSEQLTLASASALFDHFRYSEALGVLRERERIFGPSVELNFRQAQTLLAIGDYIAAKGILSDLIDSHGARADLFEAMSAVLNSSGEFDMALNYAVKALSINDQSLAAANNASIACLELEDFSAAESYAQLAVKIDPGAYEAAISLSNAHAFRWNFQEALNALYRVFDARPSAAGALKLNCAIATLEASRKNFCEAEKKYEEALAICPYDKKINVDYGIYLMAVGKRADSSKHWNLRQVILHDPNMTLVRLLERLPKGTENIIFVSEQGIGDELAGLFALQKFPHLRNRPVVVSNRVYPIARKLFPKLELFSCQAMKGGGATMGTFSYIPLLDLFPFLETHGDANYLGKTVTRKVRRLGFTWRSHRGKFRFARGLNVSKVLDVILSKTDLEIVLLDSPAEGELAGGLTCGSGRVQFPEHDCFKDLEFLLERTDSCDLVLACPNSTAHISAILGKETFVVTPPFVLYPTWYQNLKGTSSRWYPNLQLLPREMPYDYRWLDCFIDRLRLLQLEA